MANGGYWHSQDDWQRAEAPLRALDDVLEAFALRFDISLTKNHKDWPDRSLVWGGPIRKLIQIYLADEKALTFNVWLCASQDRGKERFWKREFAVESKPVKEFEVSFGSLLVSSMEKIESWSAGTLEYATSIR